MERTIQRLKELDQEMKLLQHLSSLVSWDQETYMPPRAIQERSEQNALLSGYYHERMTAQELGAILGELGATEDHPAGRGDLAAQDQALVRVFFREHSRAVKLPKDLVEKLAKQSSIAQSVWVEARKRSDYTLFKPELEKLFKLVKEKAERLGYEQHPYDALLDEYEPWMTTTQVSGVFDQLKRQLKPLITKILNAPQVDDRFLLSDYPVNKQEEFSRLVLEKMGFDFQRGRLDVSAHPFTTTVGEDDVRITTRYKENFFKTSIFGSIHEGGHALYELGMGDSIKGTMLGNGVSLGIHESQSRMWENMIGRSFPFWKYFYPRLQALFPDNLKGVDAHSFFRAVNKVEPSLVRIEADEVTYSLHVILRFEIEKMLLTGDIGFDDLPDVWNRFFKDYFGIVPDGDADGVLQDVHWSMGIFGYFPTYALGNLYAAQFYAQLDKEVSNLSQELEAGNLAAVLNWLKANVHQHGSVYTANELCNKITGELLNPEYFIRYLEEKYRVVYDF